MRNVKFKLTTISIAAVLALGVWFGLSELKKKAPDVYAKIVRTSADYAKTAGEAVERLPARKSRLLKPGVRLLSKA